MVDIEVYEERVRRAAEYSRKNGKPPPLAIALVNEADYSIFIILRTC